jgi:hypothetical protein
MDLYLNGNYTIKKYVCPDLSSIIKISAQRIMVVIDNPITTMGLLMEEPQERRVTEISRNIFLQYCTG